jgi:hypothetical protein
MTPEEQAERFRLAAEKRRKGGLPTIDEEGAAVDDRIARNIRDFGP